jgi:thiol:disulfide interchange protein DsbD
LGDRPGRSPDKRGSSSLRWRCRRWSSCGSFSSDGLAFDEEIPWQAFSDQRLAELDGHPVFIDFTAEWCLTCKVNENTVLETAAVRAGMERLGVVPLKADWTRKDAEITRWLERYGRAGVPFYLVVPGDRSRDPIPLGEVITPQSVVDAMQEGAS